MVPSDRCLGVGGWNHNVLVHAIESPLQRCQSSTKRAARIMGSGVTGGTAGCAIRWLIVTTRSP